MSILQAPSPTRARELVCPACRHVLQRRHRHFGDRVLAVFTGPASPWLRYACTDSACGWQGLLRGQPPRRPGYLPDQWL